MSQWNVFSLPPTLYITLCYIYDHLPANAAFFAVENFLLFIVVVPEFAHIAVITRKLKPAFFAIFPR